MITDCLPHLGDGSIDTEIGLSELFYDCDDEVTLDVHEVDLHASELAAALEEQEKKLAQFNDSVVHVMKAIPLYTDSGTGKSISLCELVEEVVKRTNTEIIELKQSNARIMATMVQQQGRIKELENDINTMKVDQRYTQSLLGHSQVVCSHCLANPGVMGSSLGMYYCSTGCMEAATCNNFPALV